MVIHGRDGELRTAESAVLGGRSVVLLGDAGIGKTELWRALLGAASERGRSVARVIATSTTRLIPGGALAGLVAASELPAGAGDRLVATLRVLAAGGRDFVLGVDDAHLLDDESAAALLQHVVGGGVVAATVRSGEPAPDAVVRLWKDRLAEVVKLQPIDGTASSALVEELVAAPVDAFTQTRLFEASGGVPLLLRELVAHGLASGLLVDVGGIWAWTHELEPGPNVAAVIRSRFSDLDPEVRDVAERVAIAGPLPATLLEALVPRPALATTRRSGVLRLRPNARSPIYELAHPLYGLVLTDVLPAERTRRVLEELVEAAEPLAARDRELEVLLAAWLVRLADRSHPERLVAAAERAFSHGDLALADRLARAAIDAGAGARAQRVVARIETFLGEPAGAPTPEASPGPIDVEHVIAGAEAFFIGLRTRDDALAVVEQASQRADRPTRLDLAAFALTIRLHAGDPVAGIEREARELLTQDPPPAGVARAALALGPALTVSGRPLDAIDVLTAGIEAVRSSDGFSPYLRERLASTRAQARIFAGALGEANAEAVARHAEAEGEGAGPVLAIWSQIRAHVLLWQGRPREAARRFGESIAFMRGIDVIGDATWCQAELALCLAWTDREAGANARIPAVPPPGSHGALIAPFVRLALAGRQLCLGSAVEAEREATEALAPAVASGQILTELFIQHFLARLRPTRARIERIAELASRCQGELAAVLAASAEALLPARGAALEAAARQLAQLGLASLAAEWFERAAVAHREERSMLASRRCGNCAQQQRSAMEADPLLPGPRTEFEELTAREREVATLAAQSLTNHEIAQRLGLSVRTVHSHLRTVYEKLGVNDRQLLGPLIARSGPARTDDREDA